MKLAASSTSDESIFSFDAVSDAYSGVKYTVFSRPSSETSRRLTSTMRPVHNIIHRLVIEFRGVAPFAESAWVEGVGRLAGRNFGVYVLQSKADKSQDYP